MFESERLPDFPWAVSVAPEGCLAQRGGRMIGEGSEPVEVWERHGRPVQFAWRGRLYTVLFVRDRWLVQADPHSGSMAGEECWRVEATPLRGVPPALYELCHEQANDRWSLSIG
ncbi:MAG TPA: DUF6504 family protein [Streptosporangiaceae bacterium]|nr:DUF6504 family protein [Streptosporangiaceae bacterium]